MNKLEFIHEVGDLANRFAILFKNYTASHDGYAGKTEDDRLIVIGQISVSIQDGELATISIDIGSVDSKHRIIINRYPYSENSDYNDWGIEDK